MIFVSKSDSTHWSLVDTQRVCGHPGKELPIMTPPEKKKKKKNIPSLFVYGGAQREGETGITDLKMGQCAELSQWKPLFFCPVRMSQMMMACGSSLVSISGLKVTTYLKRSTA